MKKISLLFAFIAFSLTSCSSDEPGPQGPPGPPGDDGLIGIVFDVAADDFTEENNYAFEVEYSDYTSEEVFESDVVLVYMKTGEDDTVDPPANVWSLLPQIYYVDGGGSMQYNYDYTFLSAYIFLDADVDLSTLDETYTDDQEFRVAILPAALLNDSSVNISSYEEVMSAMKVNEMNIPAVE